MTQAASAGVREQVVVAAASKKRVFKVCTYGPGWAALRDGVADEGGRPLHIDQYAAFLGGGR